MQKFLNRLIKFNIYLLTFLMPVFWLPFSFEAFEFNKQYLLFFMASFTFFIWVLKMVSVEKEFKIRFSLMDAPVLAFAAVAILSSVFSIDKTSSILGFYGRFSDGLLGLLSMAMFYFLVTNNIATKKKANTGTANDKNVAGPNITISGLLKVFLWAVFIAIFLAYFSVFGLWGKINEITGGNLPLTMQSPVFNPVSGSFESFGVWLAVIVAFLVGTLLNGEGKRLKKIAYWALLLSSLFLLAIIDSRTIWMILLLVMTPLLVFSLVKRIFSDDVNRLLIPVFLIILSTAFIFLGTSNLKAKIFSSQLPQELVSGQGQSWLVGFKGATENLKSVFFGSGIGNWHYDFAKFKPASFNQTLLWNLRLDRPGSHFPEILATMGFLGFLSYLGLILLIFVRYYLLLSKVTPQQIAIQKEGDKSAKPQTGLDIKPQIPFLAAILALIIGQVFFYQTTVLAFTFWLFLGLWVAGGQKQVREKVISFKNFPELSLVFSVFLIIIGLAGFLIYFMAVKFYIADMNYRNGIITADLPKLEWAANLNPYQSQYKITLARAYLGQALSEVQKPEAERDLNVVSVDIYKALAFARNGQIGNTAISGATEIAPKRVAAWETLGMIYRDTQGLVAGTNEWAVKAFEEAIKLEPVNPFLHTELGKLYLTAGDTEKAKTEFNKAKTLKSDYPEPILRLSLIFEQENNLDEAIRQTEGLNNLYPYNVEVLFQLGRLYFNAKRTDDAITQFSKAAQLSPTYSNAIYALGVAYQQKGENGSAIQAFERVLELNPDNEDVKARLGSLRALESGEKEK